MAKYHGKNTFFSVDGVELSAYLNEVTWPTERDTAETSTFGQSAKTYVVGLSDATVDLTGVWDDTATTGPDVVLSGLLAEEDTIPVVFGPSGDGSGRRRYTANAYVTGYETSSPIGDVVAFTASLQISGPVVRDTFSA
jgi:hypothetical protein